MKFEAGTSYPIDTLPDDLFDEDVPTGAKWAIKDALFWNDCQGWWTEHISDVRREMNFGNGIARFWQPLPTDPMTREEILAERGMVVCAGCDYAITPGEPHQCRPLALSNGGSRGRGMNVYVCQDHQGHWPFGVASIVVAETEKEARELLVKRLAKHSIEQTEPFTLLPVDLAYPEAYVLCDGNY